MQLPRRDFIRLGAAALPLLVPAPFHGLAAERKRKTDFQIACMTLPYSAFPLKRALTGIQSAGFQYVAWGTTHREDAGASIPVMPADAPPEKAKDLGNQCRDFGLVPLLMFSGIGPEEDNAVEIFTRRIRQAQAAGIPQVLTFGHTQGGHRSRWVERLKSLGPVARDHGVTLVVKQHGGETGTGEATAKIIRDVADDGVWVNYDAGNVMDYLNVDPISDVQTCAAEIRSFCIKDHRNFPKDEDCGPGLGEIDHYKLLHPLAFTGRTMPLCCENIFAPLIPRPKDPAHLDALARRAREFLQTVVSGLQDTPWPPPP